MAVELFDLVDALKRETSPPGSDLFPDATDDSYIGSLTDAFWEVRLYGFLAGFEENAASRGGPDPFAAGVVTPIGAVEGYDAPSGYATTDLARDLQQLIVLWAGWKIVLTRLSSVSTSLRAKAGPVEYETANAATVLKAILDQLKARIDWVLKNLSAYGSGAGVMVLDSVIERTYAVANNDTWWIR